MKSLTRARRLAIAATLSLCAGLAMAQTKIDMTIFHAEGAPWTPTEKWWAQEVEKATEGRVKVQLHFGGSLVPLNETLRAVRNGAVPAGLLSSAAAAGQLRYLGYTEALTGVPTDTGKLVASLNELRPVLEKNMAEQGLVYLWSQPAGELISLCRNKFLKSPADWKGTKVRTAGRWQSEQIKAVGASPQALDPSEIYLALQNGTVDCTLSVGILAPSLKLEQVAPKVTFLRQSNNLSLFVMNKDAWAKISPKDQEAIKRVSMEADKRAAQAVADAQAAGEAFFKKAQADNTYKLSDAEAEQLRKDFAAALKPLDGESGEVGKQVKAVLDKHR
ncbi:TRAP transporter substrate-binding protein DctP [Ramlibacter sp. AW1]|uniref:TRAP transporter substrate-binding protein DctP n=1 Tax=Ramlibacter aurantiacus TaxID=2801330 RepID=A0A936ZU94_9BURK|nr:TRAP transporter substrate-binding protein DctP [Ramlibacter aurantiacus]MBL0420719.1 TRAP transporter substrate-binding protein DctP [Ramlibacter aurantiacus]